MHISEHPLYIADIDRTIESLNGFDFPCNKTILITGATGLICSSFVDLLVFLNCKRKLNWTIILAGRNEAKMRNRFPYFFQNQHVVFLPYDLERKCSFPLEINYIIHGAGNAYPKIISDYPVETLRDTIFGLSSLLEYAKVNNTRVLYISSSEVYGKLQNIAPIKESEYGYVDLLNSRSSYPMGKRAAETLCISYYDEYSVDSVIVRPGHIYGPTASEQDNRVSSVFMYDAAYGRNLVLKTEGKQIRSYCYSLDSASAMLAVLMKGQSSEAYNISNQHSICSIREMADFFAKSGNVRCIIDMPKEVEKKAFNPMLNSSLDSEKLESLGWQPVFTKEEGFEHSVIICKDLIK